MASEGKYMAYVGSYSYNGKAKGITVYDVDVASEMQWCIDNGFDLITTDAPTAFLGL